MSNNQALLAAITTNWPALLDAIEPINLRLRRVLEGCRPIAVVHDIVIIVVPSPFHLRQIEDQDNRVCIEDFLSVYHERRLWITARQIMRPRAA
jgi:DNA polymerase III subunit gamma/tau